VEAEVFEGELVGAADQRVAAIAGGEAMRGGALVGEVAEGGVAEVLLGGLVDPADLRDPGGVAGVGARAEVGGGAVDPGDEPAEEAELGGVEGAVERGGDGEGGIKGLLAEDEGAAPVDAAADVAAVLVVVALGAGVEPAEVAGDAVGEEMLEVALAAEEEGE
jgi:hypothetical protein